MKKKADILFKVKGEILFKEEQQFRTGWFWGIIIFVVVGSVGAILGTTLIEKGKTIETWLPLLLVVSIEAVMIYLMYITKLQTVITTEGIFYRWRPFQDINNYVSAADIKEAALRKGPFYSYGSRWIPGYGRVNNTGPGNGFQLVLKNGKKIFLGTQKQNSFKQAIDKIISATQRT